jgi:Cdc6-like AAA superfamily ATPase
MAFDTKVLAAVRTAFPGAGSPSVISLGAPVHDGQCHPEPLIGIPLAMMNRHGLVAGATGTGKTKTLQLMTEGLSAAGASACSSCPTCRTGPRCSRRS